MVSVRAGGHRHRTERQYQARQRDHADAPTPASGASDPLPNPSQNQRHSLPGDTLPIAGGFDIIPTPGHCAGQVALLWRAGRMLFAGDAASNVLGLADPIGFENLAEGRTRYHEIITGVVGLDETPDAFVRLQTDKSQIKILVAPGK